MARGGLWTAVTGVTGVTGVMGVTGVTGVKGGGPSSCFLPVPQQRQRQRQRHAHANNAGTTRTHKRIVVSLELAGQRELPVQGVVIQATAQEFGHK